jgi:hypothetical protein
MADEVNEQGTETSTEGAAPTDFREYAKWRESGELPEEKAQAPAAAPEAPAKTEPESDPDGDQEAGDKEDEQSDADAVAGKPGRGGSRQRRIDKLTRENEELKRQLAGVAPAQKPQDKPSETAQPPGKPKLENFQTLEAYQEALTDWKFDQRERERTEAEAKAAADQALRTERETWERREGAARKAHPDYDDLIESVTIPAGPGVLAARQAMLEDEHGAEMLYYLAKHPAELERIAGLTPASAVLAIGRLSATLNPAPPDNGKPRITGAPKPPPPSGRPAKTMSDSIDDPAVQRDFTRWTKAREAQIRGR